MAIVTAFRFSKDSGAICVDQESWHIFRRKNWFTDHLYLLVPKEHSDRYGIELAYGGVGHPPFHYEAVKMARRKISDYLDGPGIKAEDATVENLGRLVLEAMREVRRRRVNGKLHYLFGFDGDGFASGNFKREGCEYSIRQKDVKTRCMDIIGGRETVDDSPFSPPVEACLIGTDRRYGYSAFALKEKDGVLSFQSCWFESMGQGRDGAAQRFADFLNKRILDIRRSGADLAEGLTVLMEAACMSIDHYGQNGGFVRVIILNGEGASREERVIDIHDDKARVMVEMVKASNHGIVSRSRVRELIWRTACGRLAVEEAEKELFGSCPEPAKLGKLLRGYKIEEPGLTLDGPENELYLKESAEPVLTGGSVKQ